LVTRREEYCKEDEEAPSPKIMCKQGIKFVDKAELADPSTEVNSGGLTRIR